MSKRQHSSRISGSGGGSSESSVTVSRLPRHAENWLITGDISQHSQRTTEARRDLLNKLVWFLNYKEFSECGTAELRAFLHYVGHGHKEPGGRWGNPRCIRPTKPRTVKNYHGILRSFFNFVVAEGDLEVSPIDRIPVPVDRPDQIKPLDEAQLVKMLAATRKTLNPKRDEAILLLLFDTGLRATELCTLRVRDLDLTTNLLTVEGKGGKQRHLPFSRETKKAIFQYLSERATEPDEPVFLSDRGTEAGGGLTRHGLRFLIGRLGKAAGVSGVRLSPHTLRHSFAIAFLRAGGNTFTLQQMLGHTHLAMTQRYVAIAEADIANQHRQFSPVARLKGNKGK